MFRRHLFMLAAFGLSVATATAYAANPQVDLDTSAGKIRIELYPDAAPKTVENFLAYVQAKQYDGTQFHRVIPGFMIQAGGYTADFKEKPTKAAVRNEAEQSRKAGFSTPITARSRSSSTKSMRRKPWPISSATCARATSAIRCSTV